MKIISRKVSIQLGGIMDPRARALLVANHARRIRDELISKGEASETYRTIVDGRVGLPEESVKPGGVIVYRFSLLGQAATFALAYARERSPIGPTGRYRSSWVAMVNNLPWTARFSDIPPNAELVIVNSAPYHRKIHVGAIRTVGYNLVDDLRRAVRTRFTNLDANVAFVELSGVIEGFETPYRLKLDWGRAGRRVGDRITYPALVIKTRAGLG